MRTPPCAFAIASDSTGRTNSGQLSKSFVAQVWLTPLLVFVERSSPFDSVARERDSELGLVLDERGNNERSYVSRFVFSELERKLRKKKNNYERSCLPFSLRNWKK